MDANHRARDLVGRRTPEELYCTGEIGWDASCA